MKRRGEVGRRRSREEKKGAGDEVGRKRSREEKKVGKMRRWGK